MARYETLCRAVAWVLGLLAVALAVGSFLTGCGLATPRDVEGDACGARLGEPDGRTFYHAATDTVDESFPTRADVEATYQRAVERVGPCPSYEFRAEWCEPPEGCGRDTVWWIGLWEGVETCRDLYWSRGAYCRGVAQ